MPNPELSTLTMPSGTTYDLKDKTARELIDAINNWSYIVCTNASNTPKDVVWGTDPDTVTGTLVATADTMYKIYLVPSSNGTNDIYDEYVTVNPTSGTYIWEMFGHTSLPDMNGYVKNSAGHSGATAGELAYKDSATGTVNVPSTFTTTLTTTTDTVDVDVTPSGEVSQPTFSGEGVRLVTSDITVPNTFASTFTGTEGSLSVSGTPAGTVSTPTITVTTNNTNIANPTAKTVATSLVTAAPGSTAPSNVQVMCDVVGENLRLYQVGYTTGDSIDTTTVSVATGIDTATSTQPEFSGTAMTATGTFTPSGSVATQTDQTTTVSATVSSTSGVATYTPAGTVSKPTFTGTEQTFTSDDITIPNGATTTIATTTGETVTVS